jgi:hypothetical protein
MVTENRGGDDHKAEQKSAAPVQRVFNLAEQNPDVLPGRSLLSGLVRAYVLRRRLDLEHLRTPQAQNFHPPGGISFDDIHGDLAFRAAVGAREGPNISVTHIPT